ncbi:hypothetical protein OOT46_23910 [Aquabacterium sp. A7-Y]|uniref:hypothetical protein n=1 Tax=Aquabacterium sp. A7-Y TaxID=1349605 RepID=UPI00223CEF15|nr:hypothetical protein [Aquabacterium sp. A7-Y]MCW7540871.1 hypothetical protein [Aquabacterium sp. A7-Y]
MSDLPKALATLAVQADWDVTECGARLQRLEQELARAQAAAESERQHAGALREELGKCFERGRAFNPERVRLVRAQLEASRQRGVALADELAALGRQLETERAELATARHRAEQLKRSAEKERLELGRQHANRELATIDELWVLRPQGSVA